MPGLVLPLQQRRVHAESPRSPSLAGLHHTRITAFRGIGADRYTSYSRDAVYVG